jgi:hypothetical protein
MNKNNQRDKGKYEKKMIVMIDVEKIRKSKKKIW